jgi:hypothetical protein
VKKKKKERTKKKESKKDRKKILKKDRNREITKEGGREINKIILKKKSSISSESCISFRPSLRTGDANLTEKKRNPTAPTFNVMVVN